MSDHPWRMRYSEAMRAKPLRGVTPNESAAFHRDGAVLIKGVLAQEWVECIEKGLEAVVAEPDVMSESLYQDPTRFWHIGDANSELETGELARTAGRVISVPESRR